MRSTFCLFFFFQAEDGIRDKLVTGVQTCALPIWKAGLAVEMYGIGVAAGDYDNDGHVDLFINALGPDRLFRNRGDGTFEDVTEKAGVSDPGTSSKDRKSTRLNSSH